MNTDYKTRYDLISESDWFKKIYHDSSIGEIIVVDDGSCDVETLDDEEYQEEKE
jgi:hypothetical protein